MKSVYTLGADAIYEHTKPLERGRFRRLPMSKVIFIQSYRIQMRTLSPMKRLLLPLHQVCLLRIVNEYDQEIPQSQNADNPVAP